MFILVQCRLSGEVFIPEGSVGTVHRTEQHPAHWDPGCIPGRPSEQHPCSLHAEQPYQCSAQSDPSCQFAFHQSTCLIEAGAELPCMCEWQSNAASMTSAEYVSRFCCEALTSACQVLADKDEGQGRHWVSLGARQIRDVEGRPCIAVAGGRGDVGARKCPVSLGIPHKSARPVEQGCVLQLCLLASIGIRKPAQWQP